MWLACIFIALACASSRAAATPTSAFSPHTPGTAPWFEGWYVRIQADDSSAAFGIGHYPNQTTDKPRTACFLVHRDNGRHDRTVEDHFYMRHNLDVASRPDTCPTGRRSCTPSFSVGATHGTNGTCRLAFDDDNVRIYYRTDRYTFNMTFPNRAEDVVPWSPNRSSPMGWLAHPPFDAQIKLQWFVYSLRTPATYSLQDHQHGTLLDSVPGHVHLEKNWGTGFPKSWLWSQGQGSAHVTPTGAASAEAMSTPASYAIAGGRAPHVLDWLLLPQIFTFSFQSPMLNVTVDPNHPPLWEHVPDISGCQGTAALRLRTWWHVVQLSIKAAPRDFVEVTCPNRDGFMDMAVEAFSATTHIQIFSSQGLLAAPGQLLAEATFRGAALEFGGTYRCNKASDAADAAAAGREQGRAAQPGSEPLPEYSVEL